MTIQVRTYNKNKAELETALNATPALVTFHDPGIFVSAKGDWFSGERITPGESFPVVMDHPRRNRFATVTRRRDGSFKVG